MLNTPLRLHVLRDGAESRRRPYQTSRRHPRTYILALRIPAIFSRLSTAILTFIQAVEPHLQRHPSANIRFAFLSSPYIPRHLFSRLSTTILTFLEAVGPNLQRHPYVNIAFLFLSSPYLPQHFFPTLYRHFNFSRSGGA